MSGFGSLYYTDCLPGQGLQGGPGFQFQAATPGAATDAMHLVQRFGLYEPPAAWMRERRPLEDYPPSLAHAAEEGFLATAAGRYLGQEANGTRQGNQFTHAVVTREPADYGVVRPAQLWRASWWAAGPAGGTTLDELPPDPAPGPLDVETVRDRVRGTEGGEALLRTLVSALEHLADPARRRTVVLISADPERAACWLSAATLLLPRPQALQVSFKIFVTDPQYGRHDVIALHPEWAGRWADTRDDSGLTVLDLDRRRCSAVESAPSADFWAPRFLRHDPYDVVDAVELAGQFAAARQREHGSRADDEPADEVARPTVADRLVAAVDRAGETLHRPDDVEAVAQWLLTAPEEAIAMARDTALEAVLASQPPAAVLRTMAEAVRTRRWDDAAVHRVLDGLFAAELAEAEAGDGRVALRALLDRPPLRPAGRAEADRTPARAELESALRAAPPDHVPVLLTLARRHGLPLATGAFREAADAFARWWLRQADDEVMPRRWAAPDEALDWVRDVLRGQLAAGGPAAQAAIDVVRERWWEPLCAAASDPRDGLDRTVWASRYSTLEWSSPEAAAFRHRLMDACAAVWPGPDAATAAWNILYAYNTTPALRECRAVVRELGQRGIPMSVDVAATLARLVSAAPDLSADGLALVHAVDQAGHAQRLPPALVEHRDHDRLLWGVIEDLGAAQPRFPDRALADTLEEIPLLLRLVRLPHLVKAFLAAPPERAAAVVAALPSETLNTFAKALEERWPRPGRPPTDDQGRAAALVFVMTHKPEGSNQADYSVLRRRLAERVALLGREERAAIYRALPSKWWQDAWTRWLREVDPNVLQRLGKLGSSLRDAGKRKD